MSVMYGSKEIQQQRNCRCGTRSSLWSTPKNTHIWPFWLSFFAP